MYSIVTELKSVKSDFYREMCLGKGKMIRSLAIIICYLHYFNFLPRDVYLYEVSVGL